MAEINREYYDTLDKFFRECVRFWEHELKVSSDVDKQPYLNAISEIPKNNPYYMEAHSHPIDDATRREFIKHRYMDVYGKEWERYYKEV